MIPISVAIMNRCFGERFAKSIIPSVERMCVRRVRRDMTDQFERSFVEGRGPAGEGLSECAAMR